MVPRKNSLAVISHALALMAGGGSLVVDNSALQVFPQAPPKPHPWGLFCAFRSLTIKGRLSITVATLMGLLISMPSLFNTRTDAIR
jgi:hypothetical protein